MNAMQQLLTEHMAIWTAADTEKKSGRGRASGNAGSVYGIKKLRELILELAVRGKLIPQVHEWKVLKLSDLGFWAIGSGFPTSEQGNQDNDILFVKVSDMNLAGNEKFIVFANNTITIETAKRIKINVHSAGTVIFPKIGGAIATNKRRILTRDTAIDNNCLGLTPKIGVTTEWLYLLLSSIDLSKYQAGTSVPALAQGVLQEIPVMLPSENEQYRIVAKVDELMALCDQLEAQHSNAAEAHEKLVSHLLGTLTQSQSANDFSANWQRIAAHFDTLFTTEVSIDALKQTLLQLAVMGKLVPQDANDEPASELLKRIQAEKAKLVAEGKIKKDKPLAAIGEDEKPFELPHGWEWARLERFVLSISSGGTPSKNNSQFWSGNIPWASVKDLNIEKYLETTQDFISEEGLLAGSKLANKGDLIICTRMGLGKIAIAAIEVAINQDLKALKVTSLLDIDYFINFYSTLKIIGSGMTVAGIRQDQLLGYLVPTPPLAEQRRIVTKVNELMTLCDQLKTRIQQANRQQQVIANALVMQAVT